MTQGSQGQEYSLNVLTDYRGTQGVEVAVRELGTNAQDVNPTDYAIYVEDGSLFITNGPAEDREGNPVSLMRSHWFIGKHEKFQDGAVGTHGEGLKIGVTILLRLGYTDITIRSGYSLFIPYIKNVSTDDGSERVIWVRQLRMKQFFEGTQVKVENFDAGMDLKKLFLHQNDPRIVWESGHTAILGNSLNPDFYAGRVRVCSMESVLDKPWYFGYNAHAKDVTLGRDRDSVSSNELKWVATRMWQDVRDSNLWSAFWKAVGADMGESTIYFEYLHMSGVEKIACKEGLEKAFGESIALSTNPRTTSLLDHYPEVTVVHLKGSGLGGFLVDKMGMKTDEEILQGIDDLRALDLESGQEIDLALNVKQAATLRSVRLRTAKMATYLERAPFSWNIKREMMTNGEGELTLSTIYGADSFISKTVLEDRVQSFEIANQHMLYHFWDTSETHNSWKYVQSLLELSALYASKEVI